MDTKSSEVQHSVEIVREKGCINTQSMPGILRLILNGSAAIEQARVTSLTAPTTLRHPPNHRTDEPKTDLAYHATPSAHWRNAELDEGRHVGAVRYATTLSPVKDGLQRKRCS